MRDHDRERRQFLALLISAPAALALDYDRALALVAAPALSPEDSLKKLILQVGPWSPDDRSEADHFARRFLKSSHAVGPYLPGSSKLVQQLASRLPADAAPLKEIDLGDLPKAERDLLLSLVKQLYSLVEVRNVASNEPPIGECQGHVETWHTRPPS
jgi:hypothetical protein